MYESRRLGTPLSREKLERSPITLPVDITEVVSNEKDKAMNSDRTISDKGDSDVEVEVVGDTKKVYVYSPVFTKEDEELYRFVSSRVEDAPDNDDASSSISSTDSLEGASSAVRVSREKTERESLPREPNGRKENEDLRDSLDNTWEDPPRMEDMGSTVPPLDIRGVETPVKPREKDRSHRKKGSKKKSQVADNSSTNEPVNGGAPQPAMIGPAAVPFENPQGLPNAYFSGGNPAAGIVYFAAPGMPGMPGMPGTMPIPFPFMLPNQQMLAAGGAVMTEAPKSTDSDETITEKPSKHRHKHHTHKSKRETRDVGEMTTPDNTSSSIRQSNHNSLSSATLHDSLTVPSGSSSQDPFIEDDYFNQYERGKGQIPISLQQWGGNMQGVYEDEYYYEKEQSSRSMENQQQHNKSKIATKPFGRGEPSEVPNNLSQAHKKRIPQQPLPFRRNDVDYVEKNKRTYGRLKGSSYGQILDRRQDDKAVTEMIDEERVRIRMKVEQAAALRKFHKLNGGYSRGVMIAGEGYPSQEFDEGQYYDEALQNENFSGRFPTNSTEFYDESYYQASAASAESSWYANAEKLAYQQEKKVALRKANDSAGKSSSAPTKMQSHGPSRLPPSGQHAQMVGGRNQLTSVTEEAGPNRYRVNHEIQSLQNMNRGPPARNQPIGPLPQQQPMQRMMPYHQQQFMQQNPQMPMEQMANHQVRPAFQEQGYNEPVPGPYFRQPQPQVGGYYPPNQQTFRLSNSFSHQNLAQLDPYDPYQQEGGNFPYERNIVGQAADWPLMSSRQVPQYYGDPYDDPQHNLNQYNLLPPIAPDDDTPHDPSRRNGVESKKGDAKIRARSEYVYPKDRQGYQQLGWDAMRNDNQAQSQNTGSYASNFKNQLTRGNQTTSYKPYTLKDFRQLKKELQMLSRVGGLGPDLDNDAVRMKAERQSRRLKYAQFVEEVNKHALEQYRDTPRTTQKPSEEQVRRQKVLDYARNVPKPKVVKRVKPEQQVAPKKNFRHRGNSLQRNLTTEETDDCFLTFRVEKDSSQSRIEEMRRRHEQDKQLAYNSGRQSNYDDPKQVRFS